MPADLTPLSRRSGGGAGGRLPSPDQAHRLPRTHEAHVVRGHPCPPLRPTLQTRTNGQSLTNPHHWERRRLRYPSMRRPNRRRALRPLGGNGRPIGPYDALPHAQRQGGQGCPRTWLPSPAAAGEGLGVGASLLHRTQGGQRRLADLTPHARRHTANAYPCSAGTRQYGAGASSQSGIDNPVGSHTTLPARNVRAHSNLPSPSIRARPQSV